MIPINGKAGKTGGRVIALGMFDGVHRGHQELLRQGKIRAEREGVPLRVCTFDRHPLEVIFPDRAPLLLNTPGERETRMAVCGVDELRVMPFDREMADTSPEEFIRMLREEQEIRAVVAGWNYTFGRGGAGTAEMLQEDGKRKGYEVLIVPPVRTQEGEIISSSAIREKLRSGDFDGAAEMLGYDYPLTGPVTDGKHIGRRIGSPTANVAVNSRKQLPAYGVYACRMICDSAAWNAVVNIGLQPTLPSGKVTVEAHALDAAPDLYGQSVELRLIRYLRPEIRFESVEALEQQIRQDIQQARAVL